MGHDYESLSDKVYKIYCARRASYLARSHTLVW
eukprot:SAG31_NODE_3225_length_4519_cov_2.363122_6_plen_32_part_01